MTHTGSSNFITSNICADGLSMPRDVPAFHSHAGTDQKWPAFVVWPEKQQHPVRIHLETPCQKRPGEFCTALLTAGGRAQALYDTTAALIHGRKIPTDSVTYSFSFVYYKLHRKC